MKDTRLTNNEWEQLRKLASHDSQSQSEPTDEDQEQGDDGEDKEWGAGFDHVITQGIMARLVESMSKLSGNLKELSGQAKEDMEESMDEILGIYETLLRKIDERLKKPADDEESVKPYLGDGIRTCENAKYEYKTSNEVPEEEKKTAGLKIGVVCSMTNPLHHVHVLMGLKAMAEQGLDRVLLAATGLDKRKVESGPTRGYRFCLTREILKIFEPLITFTDIGDLEGGEVDEIQTKGESSTKKQGVEGTREQIDGEDYTFKLFEMNDDVKM